MAKNAKRLGAAATLACVIVIAASPHAVVAQTPPGGGGQTDAQQGGDVVTATRTRPVGDATPPTDGQDSAAGSPAATDNQPPAQPTNALDAPPPAGTAPASPAPTLGATPAPSADAATPSAAPSLPQTLPEKVLNWVLEASFFGLNFLAVWFAAALLLTILSRNAMGSAASDKGRARLWKRWQKKYRYNEISGEYQRLSKTKSAIKSRELVDTDARGPRVVQESFIVQNSYRFHHLLLTYIFGVVSAMWFVLLLRTLIDASSPHRLGINAMIAGGLLITGIATLPMLQKMVFVWRYSSGRDHIVIDPEAIEPTDTPYGQPVGGGIGRTVGASGAASRPYNPME